MASPDPRVTAVVLTHNRRDEVCRTVARLQALPERPPIIVVDNASSDGTRAALTRSPDITVVALSRNLGAAGRNVGLDRARTPYVALCDDDTWWAPGALRRAADILDASPRVAVVSGRVLVGRDGREDPTCAVMAASPLPRRPDLPGVPLLGFLAGASVVRRSVVLDAGGFEPAFFLGGEEKLLATDLVVAGWAVVYVADLVVHHDPSPRRDAAGRRRLVMRNALWFTWLRRRALPAGWLTLRLVLGAARDPELRRGVIEALVGGRWVVRRRRPVPRSVEAQLTLIDAIDLPPIRPHAHRDSRQYRSAAKASSYPGRPGVVSARSCDR